MSNRHALVIGNSHYINQEEFPTIEYAINDANKVFFLLTSSQTSIFSKETSVKLIDVDRDDFNDALNNFFANIYKTDTVLVYFAGHAKVVASKRLLLIMRNSNPQSLAHSAFSVDHLLPYFEERQINRYIVILDCCRSGVALKTPGIRYRGITDIDEVELQNISGHGKVFLASALEYQLAHELENLNHGLFSKYFIQGIETGEAVDSSKKYIGVVDICGYVRQQMISIHSELSQEPMLSGEDLVGELIVALNPQYEEENSYLAEILEFMKKSLSISDISDKGSVDRARIKKLQVYIDEVSKISQTSAATKNLIFMYGEALGLSETDTEETYSDYLRSLKFEQVVSRNEDIKNVNGLGRAILFSAAYTTQAYESSELEAGVFSYYFHQALLGFGANKNGFVTLSSSFDYIKRHVTEYENLKQHPVLAANLREDPVLTDKSIDWKNNKHRRLAILIGVDRYSDRRLSPLRFAAKDATTLSNTLKTLGGFEIIMLLNEEANRENVIKVISEAKNELKNEDLLLLYFTGHGFATERDGHAVLFDTTHENLSQGLAISEITHRDNDAVGSCLVIVLDACMMPANPSAVLPIRTIID
jgi:uncharacterized caspase-like protein